MSLLLASNKQIWAASNKIRVTSATCGPPFALPAHSMGVSGGEKLRRDLFWDEPLSENR